MEVEALSAKNQQATNSRLGEAWENKNDEEAIKSGIGLKGVG